MTVLAIIEFVSANLSHHVFYSLSNLLFNISVHLQDSIEYPQQLTVGIYYLIHRPFGGDFTVDLYRLIIGLFVVLSTQIKQTYQ